MNDLTVEKALANKDALKAIGKTDVFLYGETAKDAPWSQATDIELGGSYRFSGPASVRLIAEIDGIKFSWHLDFEGRDANGTAVSQFDRDGMREAMRKLPVDIRKKFGRLLAKDVMPELHKRTLEVREWLNKQLDSEDCVRGLIAFAAE